MINKNKLRNTFLLIFIAFLLLPSLMPSLKEINENLHYILNFFRITNAIIGLNLFLFNNKRLRHSLKITAPILLFFIIYIISTKINSGDMNTCIINSVNVLSGVLIISWAMNYTKFCLEAMLIDYKLIIYINFLTMLIYKNGLYKVNVDPFWLLGHDNTFIWTYIPAICISLLLSQMIYGKLISKKNIMLIIICTISLLIKWTAMGIVGMMIFILFIIYESIDKKLKKSIFRKLFSCNFILYAFMLNIGIVFFRIHYLFRFLIEDILHKSVSLSGRDQIWDVILPYIVSKPIIGNGYEFIADRIAKLHVGYFTFNHCHNIILNIIYEMGIIGIGVFCLNIIIIFKELSKYKYNIYSKIISISLAVYILVLITESNQKYTIFLTFIIARYIKDIIEKYNN